MNLFYKILALTFAFLLNFFITRGIIRMYIDNELKKRERKQRAKDQSLKEWFFYKKYRDVLPKPKLIWYFSGFITYFVAVVMIIIFSLLNMTEISRTVLKIYFYGYGVLLVAQRMMIASKS